MVFQQFWLRLRIVQDHLYALKKNWSLIGDTKSLDHKKYNRWNQNIRNPQDFTKTIAQSQKTVSLTLKPLYMVTGAQCF